MRFTQLLATAGALAMLCAGAARADIITPLKYPTGPSQAADTWYTDRYAPNAFDNIGTFQGRNDVLEIGIDVADSAANRPSNFSSSFYNTQGRKYDIGEPFVTSLSASLFVGADWQNLTGTASRRTGMWATISPASQPSCPQSNCNLFPIISLISDDAGARFRVWDSNAAVDPGWQEVLVPVDFDEWYDLEMVWTGAGFEYFINSVNVYSDSTIAQVDPSFGSPLLLSNVIMQGYNFGESYDAHWADIQVETQSVPLPATLSLMALGLLAVRVFPTRRAAA